MAGKPVLFSYFRSSCSWRVRIALTLKEIDYEYKAVNLLKGEQLQDEYRTKGPMGQVPSLYIDGVYLSQSLPIIEYLEETRGGYCLLPKDPKKRVLVRQISEIVNSGIQPCQNLSLLKYYSDEGAKRMEWAKHFITLGFESLEKVLDVTSGKYCVGDDVTMADLCLVPQVYNANRFKVDMSRFPVISRIHDALTELDAFKAAHPSKQPDCPDDLK